MFETESIFRGELLSELSALEALMLDSKWLEAAKKASQIRAKIESKVFKRGFAEVDPHCRFCQKKAYWQCPQADLIGKDIDPNDPRIDWVPTCDECAEGWWDGAKWGPIPFRMVG